MIIPFLSARAPEGQRQTSLIVALVLVYSSQVHASNYVPATNLSCPSTWRDQFRAFLVTPGSMCSASAPSTQHPDEFLSFEEWKSLRLSESPSHLPDKGVSSSNESREGVPDVQSSLPSAPPSSYDHYRPPIPSLRVPLTDRFNYAAQDCSARIHVAHKSSKSPHSILSPKRDKYMLSPCSAPDKYVVVELCDDIQIDTIQLANFEFFSGVFKDISVSVAQTYPAEQWTNVGTYRAKNIRGVQSFHPPQDFRFYRYVRIDFLSHYGAEYYCPVSLLRVYGLTQIEEYKWDEWQAAWRREQEAHEALWIGALETHVEPQPPDSPALSVESEVTVEATSNSETPSVSTIFVPPKETTVSQSPSQEQSEGFNPSVASITPIQISFPPPPSEGFFLHEEDIDDIVDRIMVHDLDNTVPVATSTISDNSASASPIVDQSPSEIPLASQSTLVDPSPSDGEVPVIGESSPPVVSKSDHPEDESHHNTALELKSNDTATLSTTVFVSSSTVSTKPATVHISTQTRVSNPSSPTSSMGESIYRTIMNRLGVLESNSSLGVRYVEDQTRSIRDALRRLEDDVGRLESISNQQQQVLRRTMSELHQQRREMDSERLALLSQLSSLSDEITLEKRLGLAQLCLLLMVLIFMTLTRGPSMGTSFLDGLSAPSGVISNAKRRGSFWHSSRPSRASSEPEKPKLHSDFLSSASLSNAEVNPSEAQSTDYARFPLTATPAADGDADGLVEAKSPSHPFRSPRIQHLRPFAAFQHLSVGNDHALEDTGRWVQSRSPPPISRREYATPRNDHGFPSSSGRKALAKTAHIHEVGRRRRVSSLGKTPLAVLPSPATDENRPDLFSRSSPGGSVRARSRPRSRGEVERARIVNMSGTRRPRHSSSGSAKTSSTLGQPSSLLATSPPSTPSASNWTRGSDGRTTPSAGSSDAWEDTSDPGDDADDGEEDLTLHSRRALHALLEAKRTPPRRKAPPDIFSDVPRNWTGSTDRVVGSSLYSSESHRGPVPPVGLK